MDPKQNTRDDMLLAINAVGDWALAALTTLAALAAAVSLGTALQLGL
jgi:hypothetical protein